MQPTRSTTRRALVWVFGELDKRGSFEDYVLHLAERSHEADLALDVVAGPRSAPGLREDLEALGSTLSCVSIAERDGLPRFIREMRRVRPALVHCHFGSPSTVLAPVAWGLGAKAFVVTDHGSRAAIEQQSGVKHQLRMLRRRAQAAFIDTWLPVSSFVGDQVVNEVAAPRGKVRTLFNGIDLARANAAAAEGRAAIRTRLGLPANARIALFIGNLTAEKGTEDLLAMQQEILGDDPDRMLLWVGDGPLRAKVEATADARIRVLGRRSDVPDLVQASNMLLAPSRWLEAFSLALAEAAAGGIPVVAARIGGIPEVVQDGETGLLVQVGDRAGFTASARRLMADPDYAAHLGAAGRRRAETVFSLDRMITRTLEEYRTLLDGVAVPSSNLIARSA